MRTVVLGPMPPDMAAPVERRRSLGLDDHDEVSIDEVTRQIAWPAGE